MTMETFVRNISRTQAVRDTIQAACRSVIGIRDLIRGPALNEP